MVWLSRVELVVGRESGFGEDGKVAGLALKFRLVGVIPHCAEAKCHSCWAVEVVIVLELERE